MKYIEYKTIDSTNNEAKRLINEGKIAEPTCLSAKEQTAGRGRQGKSFFSPDTGLYMTVVFPVNCPISSQVTMTTRTACAVADAIEECTGKDVGIKWVNDIYTDGKKCCGILCEAVNDYEQGRMKFIVIGIGINVYTKEWPDDLKDIAGSLFNEEVNQGDGSLIDLRQMPRRSVRHGSTVCLSPTKTRPVTKRWSGLAPVIDSLKNRIAETLDDWLFNVPGDKFITYYKSHSIVLGKNITFIENGETREGTAIDIDENGGLVVEAENKYKDEPLENNIAKDMERIPIERKRRILSSGEISVRTQ